VSILLAAQFRSKRFAEYFPPFAVLVSAFSVQAFNIKQTFELPEDFRRDIDPYLDADKGTADVEFWRSFGKAAQQASVWVLGIALAGIFMANMVGLQYFGIDYGGLMGTISGNDSTDKYQRAAEWMVGKDPEGKENIPEGERIFNANWDDFPKLFFHDQKHSYVYGLDPNYLYSEHPDLYKLLTEITAGKVDDAGPQIRDRFGAKYVFTDAKENEDMGAKLLESGWAEIIYEDDEARVLRIRDQKGDAPNADDAPETPEEKKILDEEEKKANTNANAEPEEEENVN